MRGHNLCFNGEIWKIIPKLLPFSLYLEPCKSLGDFNAHDNINKLGVWTWAFNQLLQLCTARTVFFNNDHCTVIHCDVGGVSLVNQ